MTDPSEVLKEYWGYESFRTPQEEVIRSILSGKDTLALMPTGGGKSICFQVPAMVRDGICLVVSPLVALMKDQVFHLKKKGIPALFLYAGMRFPEVSKTLKNAAYGNFKFLYVSPERLESELFLEYLPIININLIAVDEAHCVSQWGYDFRPPYLRIANIRLVKPTSPVLALTASATLEVQDDICAKLAFRPGSQKFHQSFERDNLSYSVFKTAVKQQKLIEILQKVGGTSIVYCKSRRRTKEIADLLASRGFSSGCYHAGLINEEKNLRQEAWINNQIRVMVCTNAFGMGIDKPDVRTVVHLDIPDALENYYQEAGRAGRDGKKAYAVLLYEDWEIKSLQQQVETRFPSMEMIRKVYGSLVNYFQLPAGSGEDLSFDFDIVDFSKKFQLSAPVVNNVLQLLQQESLIVYQEQFFLPSMIVFTADSHELASFRKNHTQYDNLIDCLLRSYEGIFDYPVPVSENSLAKNLSIGRETINAYLTDMTALGILDYTAQKERPQIRFLQHRVVTSDLMVNQANLQKRKAGFEKRLQALTGYVADRSTCRSQLIATYFNALDIPRCGVCDNCLHEKKMSKTARNP